MSHHKQADASPGQQPTYARVEALFHEVLARPRAGREAFLEEACGGDAALRRAVQRLLAADDDSDAFLSHSALGGALGAARRAADESADRGRRVGPYRLVRQLGTGGMGVVWLAERADRQFDREVAVKLIRRGMDSDEILRRFQRERQVLARLEHPHIARLHDGGVTEDGRPFLIMERVAGEPITAWCDARRLDIRARLTLFRAVCGAVQYAHQNLVVHRDLKPGNILVTPAGDVKLLDFGIAKVLTPAEDEAATLRTAADTRLMTPRYASPEQVTGRAVTTASDVYSLGVILFELLTGADPYEPDQNAADDYARCIRDGTVLRPSTAVTRAAHGVTADGARQTLTPETRSAARNADPRTLRHRLAGDLDTIVLTALQREPGRRYASAEALSNDIRRHLENLPIEARRDTWTYRAAKFVRRNLAGVAAAALAAVAVSSAAVVAGVMYAQAEHARQAQADQRAVAEQINEFVNGMLQAVDPSERGRDVTVREVLDSAARRVAADLGDQPLVERGVRMSLAGAYLSLGRYEEGLAHAGRALELDTALRGPDHPDTAYSVNEVARALEALGDYPQAELHYRDVLRISELHFGVDDPLTAEAENNLALLLLRRGAFEEADQLFAAAERTLARTPGAAGQRTDLLCNQAALRYAQGDYAAAEEMLTAALHFAREQLGPTDVKTTSLTNNLGGLLMTRGRYTEAEALFRDALAARRETHGDQHPMVATGLNNLGWVVHLQGRHAEAVPLLAEGLAIRRARLGDGHPDVAKSLNNLAIVYAAQGDHAAAVEMHRDALAAREAALGPDHPDFARSLSNLAHALDQLGEPAEAERLTREALAIRRRTLGPEHPDTAVSNGLLARLLHADGRAAEAEPLCRAALAVEEAALGPDHPRTHATRVHLGRILTTLAAFDDAEELLLTAHEAGAPKAAEALAELYAAWQRPADAATWRAQAVPPAP